MHQDTRKVVLVGTGAVGMSYAYALLNQGIVDELVLIDINQDKAEGEAMDLNHGLAYAPKPIVIRAGDYRDCQDADIVVITAGKPQKPHETRRDLVDQNTQIMKDVVKQIMAHQFAGIILVTTNPVDVMTYVAQKVSGLPKNRVFGSGTSLDTARLRYLLSCYFGVNSKNMHAYVIGEHGDSEFVPWSNTYIGTTPLLDVVRENSQYQFTDLERIHAEVRDAAYKIIEKKQATFYGIGMALAHITQAIFNNSNTIIPVSAYVENYYGVSDIYIGLPAVINRQGIRNLQTFHMTKEEQDLFIKSAQIIKEQIQDLILK